MLYEVITREIPFVPIYEQMTEAVSKHPEMYLCGRDRIHPSRTGHLLVALEILKAMGADDFNSSVSIEPGKVTSKNAQVSYNFV